MKALIVDTQTRIEAFDEPVRDSLLMFSTLGAQVDKVLRDQGLAPFVAAGLAGHEGGDGDDLILVIADRMFISAKTLRDFLRQVGKQGPGRLALRRSPSVDYLRPVSDVEIAPLEPKEYALSSARMAQRERDATEKVLYDVFVLRVHDLPKDLEGEALLSALRQRCPARLVSKRELILTMRLPTIDPDHPQNLEFPVTATVAAELRHWVHILWLNHLAMGMYWMERVRQHPLWMLGRALSAFPYNHGAVQRRLVVQGRGCRIHPTAHVEMSVLGDGVVIGPHASVRNSFVGDAAVIGERATLLTSLVGAGSFVTHKTFLVWSAAYPEATIGNYKLQVSLIGRKAHLNPWAGLIDAKFRGAIMVQRQGQLYSTERSFLGSCVGHQAWLAAKVLIQPGRTVPNNTVVVMRPDEVIASIPQNLPKGLPMVRDQGTLVPLESILASKNNML